VNANDNRSALKVAERRQANRLHLFSGTPCVSRSPEEYLHEAAPWGCPCLVNVCNIPGASFDRDHGSTTQLWPRFTDDQQGHGQRYTLFSLCGAPEAQKAPWVYSFPPPRPRMKYPFDKKPKTSLKSSHQALFLGIPTNIAAGPLGFRAEFDIGPKGECSPSQCRDPEAGISDSTVALGEKGSRALRVVFQDKGSETQEPPAPEALTHGAVVGGTTHINDPTSKYFRVMQGPTFMVLSVSPPLGEDTGDAEEGEGKSSEASRGTCRDDCGVRSVLTPTSCEARLEGHRSWRCRHSLPRREGGRGGVWPTQSRPGRHLRRL